MSFEPRALLDADRIAAAFAGRELGHTVVHRLETQSTNDEARRMAAGGGRHGLMVFAEVQTDGRGRRGAAWFSPPRENLLFSVLLMPRFPLECWPRLTHAAALAVCEAIESLIPTPPRIKWPNDVHVSGRKIAGILLESSAGPGEAFAILGIGLNVNTTEFPPGLSSEATSLRLEIGARLDRNEVAVTLIEALNRRCADAAGNFPALLAESRRRGLLIGNRVRARTGACEWIGLATDYDADGSLVLALDSGERLILTAAENVRLIREPA
jgi:BirA family biotin operon repressor/biotin-[acetyl-CoA-carboxylase] ligase